MTVLLFERLDMAHFEVTPGTEKYPVVSVERTKVATVNKCFKVIFK